VDWDRLPDWVIPGASFVDAASPNIKRHELWHVRALVDGLAACRRWSKEKQRWHYQFWSAVEFHVRRDSIVRRS
jgi:hypothetical protein